jgi:hypothetical protein
VKHLTAEHLFTLVKENKVSYDQIKDLEPKKFGDLEYTMKLIFNHDEEQIIEEESNEASQNDGKGVTQNSGSL